MERNQIENIYRANGLGDFVLRNLGDIYKIHGINAREVEGYSELSDEDKKAYENYIVRQMNMMGMMSRITFFPTRIYRAYGIDYLIEQYDEESKDTYNLVVGGEVWNCNDSNDEIMVKKWTSEKDEVDWSKVHKEKMKDYLRIEYRHDDREEWLHIINSGNEWY